MPDEEEQIPLPDDSSVRTDDAPSAQRNFTDMTLFEVFQAGLNTPKVVIASLWDVLNAEQTAPILNIKSAPTQQSTIRDSALARAKAILGNHDLIRLVLYSVAFWVALLGSFVMGGAALGRRAESVELAQGAPFFLMGVLIWLFAELVGYSQDLRKGFDENPMRLVKVATRSVPILFVGIAVVVFWQAATLPHEILLPALSPAIFFAILAILIWVGADIVQGSYRWMQHHRPEVIPASLLTYFPLPTVSETPLNDNRFSEFQEPWYMRISLVRLGFALVAMILSVMTWFGSANNNLPTLTLIIWFLSVIVWAWVFTPTDWNPIAYLQAKREAIRGIAWRSYAVVFLVLALILTVGIYFRIHNLDVNPREMTDDHVEKILDSGLIRDGMRPIFLANNGGREPFQMYMIALASHLPGLGINHYTIKWVAVVESILTLPVLFWLGYELLSGETRRRRLLMGIFLMALVAVSYWHVAVTRQGLRIVLTPLIASLLLIYLARAVRRNHRADFIKAGLILGAGLYMYQAVRMLPIVVVVAIGLALYFVATNWQARRRYVVNLLVLTWLTLMIFIPMLHYSVEQPDLFWRRTAGRLLGDDLVEETLADGTIVTRTATLDERFIAFQENIPTLVSNVRNVLLMFNWKGDVATISGIPNRPVFDPISGTLLIVGCGAWFVLMIRKRDLVYSLVPIFILIMLLPSALSIALPVENPSNTRTSGALPAVYLLAALPLTLFVDYGFQQFQRKRTQLLIVGLGGLVVLGSFGINQVDYFDNYPPFYAESFHPYSEAGDYLRGFVLTGGSYGNAFMIGYPYWWSHRAIGLAGGLEERWPNGIERRTDIPSFLRDAAQRGDQFRYDPDRDIIFFLSPNDTESTTYLQELFPNGYLQEQVTYQVNDNFMVFRVPALGQGDFLKWMVEHLQ